MCISPTYSVIGASFPGVPAIVLGHNDWIGWGITNTGADVQDTFIMYQPPNNDTHYLCARMGGHVFIRHPYT